MGRTPGRRDRSLDRRQAEPGPDHRRLNDFDLAITSARLFERLDRPQRFLSLRRGFRSRRSAGGRAPLVRGLRAWRCCEEQRHHRRRQGGSPAFAWRRSSRLQSLRGAVSRSSESPQGAAFTGPNESSGPSMSFAFAPFSP
ncbi:MAG TPA: hypothetical protein DCQ98_08675 [Planctomycetaceae bacterium]|nr:hypothetical protein [Planctomycetaceae bacterium]